ncbi:hypothetical protein NMG60_11031150 [Bertholletia excelsa]
MLRKQDSVLSSSMSRRENVPTQKGASVGCMAGIVQLVTKYQTRRSRRFLITFVSGRKKQRKLDNREEDVPSSASKVSKFPSIGCLETANIMAQGIGDRKEKEEVGDKFHPARRLSSQVPRSPTLPAELRRSNNNNNNIPSAILAPAPASADKIKVLGALKKCNEDLKAIQKIIESLRPDAGFSTRLPISTYEGNGLMEEHTRRPRPQPQEQTRSWKSPRPRPKETEETKGRWELPLSLSFFHRVAAAASAAAATTSRSKALTESVNEICRDIEWGEQREVGRIGLVLQDHICRDLILEIVKDFITTTTAATCDSMHSLPLLPLDSCRRRLPF